MVAWDIAGIGGRVRSIIEREDGGDVDAAARRLGVRSEELGRLELPTTGDGDPWLARLLAKIVRTYRVDACWLLTGEHDLRLARLPATARLAVANLLLDISDQLFRTRHGAQIAEPIAAAN
jgi:hypothetical protein